MRHFVIVGILVVAVAFLANAGLVSAHLMPVEASAQATEIDWMWNLMLAAMSFLFALITVPMFYSLVVFRRKKGDTTDAEHIEGNTPLEITWTVIPLFVVVIFAYLGAGNLARTIRNVPDAMVVKVVGSQWNWKFVYPDYGVTSQELYLPKGKAVLLKMESMDVIHSFWVPEFRVKQDLVPGRVTELRITPILDGSYKVRCAELCGTSHYKMEQPVIVTDNAEFTAWITDQQAKAAALVTPESKGEALVAGNGCAACHSINGAAGIGPTWFGLGGAQVELEDGTTVTADDAYLIESIKNPKAKIVKGFAPVMPNTYAEILTDEEIANIVAYIKTLK
ncbi:MAG: cytochrome c oxidase subunit II [Chloroflexota bacterium]